MKESGVGDLCCHDCFDVAIEGDSGIGLGGNKVFTKGYYGVIGCGIEKDNGLLGKERKP